MKKKIIIGNYVHVCDAEWWEVKDLCEMLWKHNIPFELHAELDGSEKKPTNKSETK